MRRCTHLIKQLNKIIYIVVNVLMTSIFTENNPKLIICDVQLKHANTILLLRMLHQYNWLSRHKCICDWLSRRKSTGWWIIVCSNWQHKLCATLSANINIDYRLPIKIYYHICTVSHIRFEIIHGSQNVFWVLSWVGGY